MKSKQNRKIIALPFDEIEYDDEWITKDENNDEDEQPQGEGDGGKCEKAENDPHRRSHGVGDDEFNSRSKYE